MDNLKTVLKDFLLSLKSKRVVGGILTILFMSGWSYFNLKDKGISEDTVNNLVITVAALIVGETVRPVNPQKGVLNAS